jgi:hypothetical protein
MFGRLKFLKVSWTLISFVLMQEWNTIAEIELVKTVGLRVFVYLSLLVECKRRMLGLSQVGRAS